MRLVSGIVLAFGALWVALLIHELGHALAARISGVRLWAVRLGGGPVLCERTVRGVVIRIALLPLFGAVQLLDADAYAIGYQNLKRARWRFTWVQGAWRAPFISAAGPLASLIGAAVCIDLLRSIEPVNFGADFVLYCLVANLGGWLNLVPIGPSDGVRVVHHLAAFRARTPGAVC